MRRLVPVLMVILTAAAVGGCGPRFAVPSLYHPGPAKVQQLRAERFDPYPQDVSRSEMVGVRPREYEKPTDEPNRAQWPWSPGAVPP